MAAAPKKKPIAGPISNMTATEKLRAKRATTPALSSSEANSAKRAKGVAQRQQWAAEYAAQRGVRKAAKAASDFAYKAGAAASKQSQIRPSNNPNYSPNDGSGSGYWGKNKKIKAATDARTGQAIIGGVDEKGKTWIGGMTYDRAADGAALRRGFPAEAAKAAKRDASQAAAAKKVTRASAAASRATGGSLGRAKKKAK